MEYNVTFNDNLDFIRLIAPFSNTQLWAQTNYKKERLDVLFFSDYKKERKSNVE